MAMEWSIDKPISAREALFRTGSSALVGVGIVGFHQLTGLGLPCPFRAMTGWLCPLCGGTHMVEALMHGDVAAAWAANPLALVAGLLVAVRAVGWAVEGVRDPGGPARHWLPGSWSRHWLPVSVVLCVAYVLVRNLAPLG